MFSEYLLRIPLAEQTLNQKAEIFSLHDTMFENCKELINTMHTWSNYGVPRFITVVKFQFTRGCSTLHLYQNFNLCFHIVSSCPGIKYFLKKVLYKVTRRNLITMSAKQYRYPQSNLSELDLIFFITKKCSLCTCHGLFNQLHDSYRRDNNSRLTSSLVVSMNDMVTSSSRVYYTNEFDAATVNNSDLKILYGFPLNHIPRY